MTERMNGQSVKGAAVYAQTNDAARNEVVAFRRSADGRLAPLGRFGTGGRGTGAPHLPSQSSVILSDDGRWLLVTNAGSDELSLFSVEEDGPRLADRVSSGGARPTSVAVNGDLVYVLNNGTPNISGFRIRDGRLTPLGDSTRPLSAGNADPAQVSFSPDGRTLVVTERGTNSISAFAIGDRGYAEGPTTIPAAGRTPYGFDFTPQGSMIVTEAFGGEAGAAAASSYTVADAGRLAPVSGSVGDTRSEVCWAAVTRDGRFAYVTNFGDGTVSSYRVEEDGSLALLEPVAGSTGRGEKGIRDEAITPDGHYLYAIDTDGQRVLGWTVGQDGRLTPVGAFEGVPQTVAGLAVS
ncbi:beta-propeller fold lactonase family protein [Frankia sp. Cppng1_Ct_nod]|uniref:lactonase family protein n=1 Tax=Frankia sp. Cppng1_Ct_nod TaxID=2897162 RepID=UPI0010410D8A|nr:beta-propeller fold lactonase family protein [Frankia sp. Cppng1_Ct_nod]